MEQSSSDHNTRNLPESRLARKLSCEQHFVSDQDDFLHEAGNMLQHVLLQLIYIYEHHHKYNQSDSERRRLCITYLLNLRPSVVVPVLPDAVTACPSACPS